MAPMRRNFLACRRWIFILLLFTILLLVFITHSIFESFLVFHFFRPFQTSVSLLFSSPTYIILRKGPSILEAFSRDKLLYVYNISARAPNQLHTKFQENKNYRQYCLISVTDVCLLPNGPIILVGMSPQELDKTLEDSSVLSKIWQTGYNRGFKIVAETPENATWVSGNTIHIIPYLGNVFHHFAERVWPHVAGFQSPLDKTTPKPINHILFHQLDSKLYPHVVANNVQTILFQVKILSLLSRHTDFLLMEGQERAVCYERLVLDPGAADRISNYLGSDIVTPALLKYRQATFSYLKIPEPQVALPPRPLRVTFYGRTETNRRRVTNAREVVEHLRSWKHPPLQVFFVDEMLSTAQYEQTFPETVSLFSQTDIFITVHGANTWAALFMPRGGAVIEIYGPCGPRTWLQTIVKAVNLKHSTEANPWKEAIASPLAGNTTQCRDARRTPDFALDIERLDISIRELGIPVGPGDGFLFHRIYNWKSFNYEP